MRRLDGITDSMATAKAAIKAGALVVASMSPGYWTRGGHFICLWKCDDTYMYDVLGPGTCPSQGLEVKKVLAWRGSLWKGNRSACGRM